MFIFSPSHVPKGTLATCPGKDIYKTSTEGHRKICNTRGVKEAQKGKSFLK